MIQPRSLRYFAEVARTGSLRHASETFFVAPSSVSKQISNLEKELGAALFDRSPRGATLSACCWVVCWRWQCRSGPSTGERASFRSGEIVMV
ncbi:LysR family transcriptional regulator [Paraburkholderia sp. IW21]|uniref:helix-turn-helix domain-containing protein n=1 Tax=Paraburkholderia sp. IW21 TaxID=3242488 RepID=UPI00351F8A93